MVGALECIVTAGSGIVAQFDERADGSMSILLRPTGPGASALRVQKRGSRKTIIRGNVDEPEDLDAVERVRKLRRKVEKGWRTVSKEDFQRWDKSPAAFFGEVEFTSSEMWSFISLRDSDARTHQARDSFHKANLSIHLNQRIDQSRKNNMGFSHTGDPGWQCRKAMLAAMFPGWEHKTTEEKQPLYKQFERYVRQGQTLLNLMHYNGGLLLTVAPLLSREEYVHTQMLVWVLTESVSISSLAMRVQL